MLALKLKLLNGYYNKFLLKKNIFYNEYINENALNPIKIKNDLN